jgi:sugar-specific transcriptional regulator TrmB
MNLSTKCIETIVNLGFTELEARIYICLIQCSPATGYKVAKEIGTTHASIYKALESLENKGAVMVDHAETRLCRAVPYEELFDKLEHSFQKRRHEAVDRLKGLPLSDDDGRIYQLKNVDQVYAKCRAMIRSAEEVLTLDVFPDPLALIKESVSEAASRGVKVLIQVYQPSKVEGAEVIQHRRGEHVLKRWPVHWIGLTCDGKTSLYATIEPDGASVHQALWTASTVISFALFSYAYSEFQLATVGAALDACRTVEEVKKKFYDWYERHSLDVPGYRSLIERYEGQALKG